MLGAEDIMCNCVRWTWSPLLFSVIGPGNPKLSNSEIPGAHFPIIRNNGRLQVLKCAAKANPSPRSVSTGDGYGQLEFEDKGDNEFELRRHRSNASLENISDDRESDRSGEELVRKETKRRRQVMKRSNMVAKQVISIQSAQSLGFVSQLSVDTTSISTLLFRLP